VKKNGFLKNRCANTIYDIIKIIYTLDRWASISVVEHLTCNRQTKKYVSLKNIIVNYRCKFSYLFGVQLVHPEYEVSTDRDTSYVNDKCTTHIK